MRHVGICILVIASTGGAWLWAQAAPPPTAPTTRAAEPGDQREHWLAAQGLVHHARSLGHQRQGALAHRTIRIQALLEMARRLRPDSVLVNEQLVELYEALGEQQQAAQAAKAYVQAVPQDYVMGLAWLRLGQVSAQTAEERGNFLKGIAGAEAFGPALRSAAAIELGGLYWRQSDSKAARTAGIQALGLDRQDPLVQGFWFLLHGAAGPIAELQRALAVLAFNPRDAQAAWRAGQVLQSVGQHESALPFYAYAHALAAQNAPTAAGLDELFRVDQVNCLLDAGKPAAVLELWEGLKEKYGQSLALRALAFEACKSLGKDDEAKAHVAAMATIFEPLRQAAASAPASAPASLPTTGAAATSAPGGRTAAQAAELAWFDLVFRGDGASAVKLARPAYRAEGQDAFIARVAGMAELAGGVPEDGAAILRALSGKDPYAAAALVRHWQKSDIRIDRIVAVETNWESRSGPGWRMLTAAAAEVKTELPPFGQVEALRQVLAKFPDGVLEAGLHLENSLAVSMLAARPAAAVGEPLILTIELKNTGKQALALGPRGPVEPLVVLGVRVEGAPGAPGLDLPHFTPVRLPASRYLGPGEKLSRSVRVDLGPVEALLTATPLAEARVTVVATLDPRGQAMVSSVPGLKIEPLVLRRQALQADGAKGAELTKALTAVLREAGLVEQAMAARQLGALITCTGRSAAASRPIAGLDRAALLEALKAALASKSAAIRGETLAALQYAELDEALLACLTPLAQDTIPMVRLRLAELLANRPETAEAVLAKLAKDDDELVRRLAAGVGEKK